MALQIAHAVGTGGMFLGKRVQRGKVLYIALEDNARRLKSRIRSQGIPIDGDIYFTTKWLPLQKGGLDELIIAIESGEYRLIVIDTLTRAFRGVDLQRDQAAVTMVLDALQHKALNHQMAILFVDHTRKAMGNNANPIDDIINSTEKTGIADQILALYRNTGQKDFRLMGEGRETESIDVQLRFDRELTCWQKIGETSTIQMTEQRELILSVLQTIGRSQLSETKQGHRH